MSDEEGRAGRPLVIRRRPWVIVGAALLLVATYGLQLGEATALGELELVHLGANASDLVASGEWFRLATGNLLHGSLLHLAVNLVALVILGLFLEVLLGASFTLVLLISSALGGSLASMLLTRATISVGASTAVFGLVAAIAYIVVLRRHERPRGIWLPALIALGIGVSDLVVPASASTDRGAHAGGFVTGLAVTALSLRGAPLAKLVQGPQRAVAILAPVLALVFAAGVARGLVPVVEGDRESVYRFAEARLQSDALDEIKTNNYSYLLALAPGASRAALELARSRMELAVGARGDLHALWDTLATLHYRLGAHDEAIEAQREALALDSSGFYADRLARLEARRYERAGPMRRGPRADIAVELRRSAPDEGAAALVLDLERPLPEGGSVHALVRRGEELGGLLTVRLPADGRRVYRVEGTGAFGNGVDFAVTLVDTRAREVPDSEPLWRLWTLRAGVGSLPPALPPESS